MSGPAKEDDRHRIDKWLWCARFFKTRALATQAVTGGKVKLNSERVKPAHQIKPGDRLAITRGTESIEVDVLALTQRRGSAIEAQACYAQTPESVELAARYREQQRLAAMSRPRPAVRPDKRERRQLDKLRRQQG